MVRLPRFLPFVALACVVSVPVISTSVARAQDAAAPADSSGSAAAAPAADAGELRKTVDDFWHYGKIARYDLAVPEGQKLLARKSDPVQVLAVFEAVADDHKDNLDQWMLRWQGVDQMRDVTTQLMGVLSSAYRIRRGDQQFIEQSIKYLPTGERAYALGISRLRESGELAVPMLLDYLRDPAKRDYHAAVRRALTDLGRSALNPLLAAADMKDQDTLVAVVNCLGEIGYTAPVPYLAQLLNNSDVSPTVKTAAGAALIRIAGASKGDPKQLKASSLFYDLAEKMYYGTSDISADNRSPVAYVWFWDDANGLKKKDVATPIFGDIMSMRMAERVLRLDASRSDAVSLWLAAYYKREADLPEGAKDPLHADDQPSAHYYGVAAGTRYLNPVLARALNDRNSAVALRTIESLQRIVGQSNVFAGTEDAQAAGGGLRDAMTAREPIVAATRYPDRLVRFEAAMALAASVPQKPFPGRERVIPVLAEALGQTGTPAVLLALPDQNNLNGMMQGLKEVGYLTAGGTSAASAVAAAESLPAVDLILISDQLRASEIDRLFVEAGQSPRLQGVPKLIITETQASPYAAQAMNNPLLSVTQAQSPATLKEAIEAARRRAGALPLDEKTATDYAMRAARLLETLALTRNMVLDPALAQTALLAALQDNRPELVKAAGTVLALLNSPAAQGGLLGKASEDKTSTEVKLSLYQNLTTSARFFGNLLDSSQIAALNKAVEGESDPQIRAGAAEARGALNLPAEEMARDLILGKQAGTPGQPTAAK